MGLTAAGTELVTGAGAGDGGLSVTASVGAGIGGVFTMVALIFVLAFLDLFSATDNSDSDLTATLYAAVVPLTLTFVCIVLYEVARVVVRVA